MVFSINRGDQFQLAQALIFLAILIFLTKMTNPMDVGG